MADKLKIIVDEIRTTIKQTFDDKVVSRAQVAYWVIIIGNKLLGQHNAKRNSGAFLNVYVVPVLEAKVTHLPNLIKGRKYIELPAAIFDYDNDTGVEYMAYYREINKGDDCKPEYEVQTINRMSPGNIQWTQLRQETRPSAKNPYFWRAGDIFPIVGIENVPIKQIEIGIYQTINSLQDIDLNSDFFFPQELLSQLKREVTDLARYSFLFPETDRNNSGNDESEIDNNKPVQKIISVNEKE